MPGRAGGELKPIRALLSVILLCAAAAAQAGARLEQTANLVWSGQESWFGGFSGAEVTDAGRTLTVISDKGRVMVVDMIREGGILIGLSVNLSVALKDADGSVLRHKDTDAEGLARGEDGQFYISFEQRHRVATLNPATGVTGTLSPDHVFADLRRNAGLEALALHPDGTLYTLPEGSANRSLPFPLYARNDGGWQVATTIPRRGPFLPVGADFDGDGLLYLLERAVTPLGFRSRIRRFDLTAPDLAEATLLRSAPAQFDNLEALSVWQDDTGQTHLTVISDDNFLAIQRTQIVEFTVTE